MLLARRDYKWQDHRCYPSDLETWSRTANRPANPDK